MAQATYFVFDHDWQAALLLSVTEDRAERLAEVMEATGDMRNRSKSLVKGSAEVMDLYCRQCQVRYSRQQGPCIARANELTQQQRLVAKREGVPYGPRIEELA